MSLAAKFTTLFLKTVSKPIASAIKAKAKDHATFRKVCIGFAQQVHRTDINLRLRLLNEKEIKVRPLNDAKAIQSGANFLAEAFVFAVGGGLIIFESWRSRRKATARRESVADDIRVLQDEITWLETKLKEKRILENDDYSVPDGVETSVLNLKHKDGTETGPKAEASKPAEVSTTSKIASTVKKGIEDGTKAAESLVEDGAKAAESLEPPPTTSASAA